MTALLKLVPSAAWPWIAGIGLSLAVGLAQQVRVWSTQAELADESRAHSSYRLEVAERDRRAATAALAETKRRIEAMEEVERNARGELDAARADAAAADASAGGLRREIERLRASRSATCSAIAAGEREASESAVVVLGELLESADRMAGELAAALDESRVRGRACEAGYDSVASRSSAN